MGYFSIARKGAGLGAALWFSAFLLLLSLFLSSPVVAAVPKWWRDAALQEKIGLSAEQAAEIQKIFDAYQEKRTERLGEVRVWRRTVNDLMAQNPVDRKALDRAIGKMLELQCGVFRLMADMKLAAREVLTTEQLESALAAEPDLFSLSRRWQRWKKTGPVKGRVMVKQKDRPVE